MQPRDLAGHPEYVPGRGIEEVARERGLDPADMITLSSNENELGPSPAAVDAIRQAASRANRYPKASHTDLTEAVATKWGVEPQQIWLANGGDGALDYLSRAMLSPGDTVLVPEPGFAYYGMAARFHHADVRQYPLRKAESFAITCEAIDTAYAADRIVYITSPHNPTGSTMSLADIETVATRTDPETLVVIDEAYGAFADADSAVDLIERRDDVAVLRSFSKSYGLAGLRLGYAIVPEAWGDAYRRVNTPFAANEIACRAGLAALDDTEHIARTIDYVREGRSLIGRKLEAKTWPSGGNFVLADVDDASTVCDSLLDRGVIVRDCTSFGLPSCIRITVAPTERLRRAIDTCNDVLAESTRVDLE